MVLGNVLFFDNRPLFRFKNKEAADNGKKGTVLYVIWGQRASKGRERGNGRKDIELVMVVRRVGNSFIEEVNRK